MLTELKASTLSAEMIQVPSKNLEHDSTSCHHFACLTCSRQTSLSRISRELKLTFPSRSNLSSLYIILLRLFTLASSVRRQPSFVTSAIEIMVRKRALSNSTRGIDSPATSPSKKAVNGSSPIKSARKTRGSVATVKAESPDGNANDSPIATAGSGRKSKVKKEEDDNQAYEDKSIPSTPARKSTRSTRSSNKKVKLEEDVKDEDEDEKPIPDTPKSLDSATKVVTPSKSTLAKKLKQLEQYLQTPFPDYPFPTAEQCQSVQDSLAAVHGLPKRPGKLIDVEGAAAGCGAVPDVLDALVRTILSQNTTSASESPAFHFNCLQGSVLRCFGLMETRRVQRMQWTPNTVERIMQLFTKRLPKISPKQ